MRSPALLVTATLALAAAASPAAGATQIGELPPEGASAAVNCTDCSFLQVTAGSYAVPPGGGVITSWTLRPGPTVTAKDQAALQVWEPAGGGQYRLKAQVADAPLTTPSFTPPPVRVPVAEGDLIGYEISAYGNTQLVRVRPGAVLGAIQGDPSVGDVFTPSQTQHVLNLLATVEPDADRDGFGDETQDACPAAADRTAAPCADPPPPPPPVTTPAPPPPPIVTPVRDLQRPVVALTGTPAAQRLRAGALRLSVRSDEAATLTTTGALRIGRKSLALPARRTALAAGRATTVSVPLGRTAAARARKALGRGTAVRAALTLTAVDAAGNRTVTTRVLRLKR